MNHLVRNVEQIKIVTHPYTRGVKTERPYPALCRRVCTVAYNRTLEVAPLREGTVGKPKSGPERTNICSIRASPQEAPPPDRGSWALERVGSSRRSSEKARSGRLPAGAAGQEWLEASSDGSPGRCAGNRSWRERTWRSRQRRAMTASQAAEAADIVVQYGTLREMAPRRMA